MTNVAEFAEPLDSVPPVALAAATQMTSGRRRPRGQTRPRSQTRPRCQGRLSFQSWPGSPMSLNLLRPVDPAAPATSENDHQIARSPNKVAAVAAMFVTSGRLWQLGWQWGLGVWTALAARPGLKPRAGRPPRPGLASGPAVAARPARTPRASRPPRPALTLRQALTTRPAVAALPDPTTGDSGGRAGRAGHFRNCLLYTSDAADE